MPSESDFKNLADGLGSKGQILAREVGVNVSREIKNQAGQVISRLNPFDQLQSNPPDNEESPSRASIPSRSVQAGRVVASSAVKSAAFTAVKAIPVVGTGIAVITSIPLLRRIGTLGIVVIGLLVFIFLLFICNFITTLVSTPQTQITIGVECFFEDSQNIESCAAKKVTERVVGRFVPQVN